MAKKWVSNTLTVTFGTGLLLPCINVDFDHLQTVGITRRWTRNWYCCCLLFTKLEPFFHTRKLKNIVGDLKHFKITGKIEKITATLYLSRGTNLVVLVVVKHSTPCLHHGAFQTAHHSCRGREASSWLLKSLPSLQTNNFNNHTR